MNKTEIVLTDPDIINFFNSNPFIEPEKFVLSNIDSYKNNYKEIKINKHSGKITVDELKKLYNDYNAINNLKSQLLTEIKDIQKSINKIKLENFDSFFTNFLNVDKKSYTCKICNKFNVMTKKGLSAHKRNCAKIHSMVFNEKEDENIDEDIEEEDVLEES